MSILRIASACAVVALVGCANPRPRPKAPEVQLTSAKVDLRPDQAVNVSDDIRKACNLKDAAPNPNFEYNSSSLSPYDRDILGQVATCFTTGPLKGRAMVLVGRADPRGETEYNMGLGDSRAANVTTYLGTLGVAPARMAATSRGELDATGTDESGWKLDRRVDMTLLQQ